MAEGVCCVPWIRAVESAWQARGGWGRVGEGSVEMILSIIQVKRDADMGKFVHMVFIHGEDRAVRLAVNSLRRVYKTDNRRAR